MVLHVTGLLRSLVKYGSEINVSHQCLLLLARAVLICVDHLALQGRPSLGRKQEVCGTVLTFTDVCLDLLAAVRGPVKFQNGIGGVQ
jgi:hypothetical protein